MNSRELMDIALTKEQVYVYLIIENTNLTIAALAKALGMSPHTIKYMYETVKARCGEKTL